MKKVAIILAVMGLLFSGAGFAAASVFVLDMDITGVIEAPVKLPEVGDWMQVGPIGPNDNPADPFAWGTIDSYWAAPGLPQNDEDDLDKYGWAMTGTITSIVPETYTIYTSGTGWMLAPGYGFDTVEEYLEEFTWTMTTIFRDSDWGPGAIADVTGTLTAEVGDRQPEGWPSAVDWSTANPGTLIGTFDSSNNTLTATVTAIPEPGTMIVWALLGAASWLGMGVWRRGRRVGRQPWSNENRQAIHDIITR